MPQIKNQRRRKGKEVLRPCWKTKKAVKHKDDRDSCNWHACNGPLRSKKGVGRAESKRTNRDLPKYSINKI